MKRGAPLRQLRVEPSLEPSADDLFQLGAPKSGDYSRSVSADQTVEEFKKNFDHSTDLDGETLAISERIVVATEAGVFRLDTSVCDGTTVTTGSVLGTIDMTTGYVQVRTPFSGAFQGYLAYDGQRLRCGERIAWIRTDSSS